MPLWQKKTATKTGFHIKRNQYLWAHFSTLHDAVLYLRLPNLLIVIEELGQLMKAIDQRIERILVSSNGMPVFTHEATH